MPSFPSLPRAAAAPLQTQPSPRSCDHWLLFAVWNNQTRRTQRSGSFEARLIDCRRSCWHSFDRPAAVGGSDQWSTSSFMNDTFLPRWLDSFPLLASFLYPTDPPPRSPFRFNNSLLIFIFFIYIFYSLSAFCFSIFNFLFPILLTLSKLHILCPPPFLLCLQTAISLVVSKLI